MAVLQERDKTEISKAFAALTRPVQILLFTDDGAQGESDPTQITRGLCEELVQLSPMLSLQRKELGADADAAKSYGIDKTPAMVVLGDKDLGLRYFGVPAGHEFSGFIENLIEVSRGEHGLPDKIVEQLAKVDQAVRLEVLFTPT